jgi:hypothetical protein
MVTILLSLVFLAEPISLEVLGVDRARELSGQVRTFTFIVAKPPYIDRGVTTVGAAERLDGVEVGAVLRGRRFDVKLGERLAVTGKLRVIQHAAAIVNGEFVPAWAELRVEQ